MFSFNFIEPFIVIPYDTRILFWNEVVDTVRPPTTRINKIKMSGVYISLVKRRQTLVRIFNSFIDRKFKPPSLMVNINYNWTELLEYVTCLATRFNFLSCIDIFIPGNVRYFVRYNFFILHHRICAYSKRCIDPFVNNDFSLESREQPMKPMIETNEQHSLNKDG